MKHVEDVHSAHVGFLAKFEHGVRVFDGIPAVFAQCENSRACEDEGALDLVVEPEVVGFGGWFETTEELGGGEEGAIDAFVDEGDFDGVEDWFWYRLVSV